MRKISTDLECVGREEEVEVKVVVEEDEEEEEEKEEVSMTHYVCTRRRGVGERVGRDRAGSLALITGSAHSCRPDRQAQGGSDVEATRV